MTCSIIKVGYLWRWLVSIGGKCTGGVTPSWDQALQEATEAGGRLAA